MCCVFDPSDLCSCLGRHRARRRHQHNDLSCAGLASKGAYRKDCVVKLIVIGRLQPPPHHPMSLHEARGAVCLQSLQLGTFAIRHVAELVVSLRAEKNKKSSFNGQTPTRRAQKNAHHSQHTRDKRATVERGARVGRRSWRGVRILANNNSEGGTGLGPDQTQLQLSLGSAADEPTHREGPAFENACNPSPIASCAGHPPLHDPCGRCHCFIYGTEDGGRVQGGSLVT